MLMITKIKCKADKARYTKGDPRNSESLLPQLESVRINCNYRPVIARAHKTHKLTNSKNKYSHVSRCIYGESLN